MFHWIFFFFFGGGGVGVFFMLYSVRTQLFAKQRKFSWKGRVIFDIIECMLKLSHLQLKHTTHQIKN